MLQHPTRSFLSAMAISSSFGSAALPGLWPNEQPPAVVHQPAVTEALSGVPGHQSTIKSHVVASRVADEISRNDKDWGYSNLLAIRAIGRGDARTVYMLSELAGRYGHSEQPLTADELREIVRGSAERFDRTYQPLSSEQSWERPGWSKMIGAAHPAAGVSQAFVDAYIVPRLSPSDEVLRDEQVRFLGVKAQLLSPEIVVGVARATQVHSEQDASYAQVIGELLEVAPRGGESLMPPRSLGRTTTELAVSAPDLLPALRAYEALYESDGAIPEPPATTSSRAKSTPAGRDGPAAADPRVTGIPEPITALPSYDKGRSSAQQYAQVSASRQEIETKLADPTILPEMRVAMSAEYSKALRVEEEHRQKALRDHRAFMSEASALSGLVGGFAFFTNDPGARRGLEVASGFTQAYLGIFDAVSLYDLKEIGTTALAAAVTGNVTSILRIMSGAGGDPTVAQLQALRADIYRLGTEMHDRFDQVDAKLNRLFEHMVEGFDSLERGIDSLQASLVGIEATLGEVLQNQHRLELSVEATAAFIRAREEFTDFGALRFSDRNPPAHIDYGRVFRAVHEWAVGSTGRAIAAHMLVRAGGDTSFSGVRGVQDHSVIDSVIQGSLPGPGAEIGPGRTASAALDRIDYLLSVLRTEGVLSPEAIPAESAAAGLLAPRLPLVNASTWLSMSSLLQEVALRAHRQGIDVDPRWAADLSKEGEALTRAIDGLRDLSVMTSMLRTYDKLAAEYVAALDDYASSYLVLRGVSASNLWEGPATISVTGVSPLPDSIIVYGGAREEVRPLPVNAQSFVPQIVHEAAILGFGIPKLSVNFRFTDHVESTDEFESRDMIRTRITRKARAIVTAELYLQRADGSNVVFRTHSINDPNRWDCRDFSREEAFRLGIQHWDWYHKALFVHPTQQWDHTPGLDSITQWVNAEKTRRAESVREQMKSTLLSVHASGQHAPELAVKVQAVQRAAARLDGWTATMHDLVAIAYPEAALDDEVRKLLANLPTIGSLTGLAGSYSGQDQTGTGMDYLPAYMARELRINLGYRDGYMLTCAGRFNAGAVQIPTTQELSDIELLYRNPEARMLVEGAEVLNLAHRNVPLGYHLTPKHFDGRRIPTAEFVDLRGGLPGALMRLRAETKEARRSVIEDMLERLRWETK